MSGFDDIRGQESVVTHFKNAIKLNKISHAYIINGEQGMGKKMVAKAFAMTLQCEKKGDNPCMECHSCKQALSGNNPDIRWVTHAKPNVISVEEVREQINSDVQIKPYSNEYKIYIVDEASKMNTAAQNALLKTIEEPPSYVVILLLTDNKEMLLSTILSRCVAMELRPVGDSIVERYLIERAGIADYRAKAIASFAGGNIGRAVKMAGSDYFLDLKDNVVKVTKNIGRMTVADMDAAVKEMSEYKENINEYIDLLVTWYRDILLYKSCKNDNNIIFYDNIREIKKQAEEISFAAIEKVLTELDSIKGKLRVNVNFDLVMELLFMTMRDCFII